MAPVKQCVPLFIHRARETAANISVVAEKTFPANNVIPDDAKSATLNNNTCSSFELIDDFFPF